MTFEYYSTVQIQRNYHDYFKNPNKEIIELIKQRIFKPLFENDLTLALNFLSRGITGNFEDKNFALYLGNRDCGKGVLYDGLENAFEGLVKTFELGNITYQRNSVDKTEVSQKLYWLLDFEFVRLGISQESQLKASGKMIKKWRVVEILT